MKEEVSPGHQAGAEGGRPAGSVGRLLRGLLAVAARALVSFPSGGNPSPDASSSPGALVLAAAASLPWFPAGSLDKSLWPPGRGARAHTRWPSRGVALSRRWSPSLSPELHGFPLGLAWGPPSPVPLVLGLGSVLLALLAHAVPDVPWNYALQRILGLGAPP